MKLDFLGTLHYPDTDRNVCATLGPTIMQPGRYRHYKGKEYLVLGVARHSETEDEFVVYRQDYGDRSLWIRPKAMFLEQVEVNGREVPRFEYIGPE